MHKLFDTFPVTGRIVFWHLTLTIDDTSQRNNCIMIFFGRLFNLKHLTLVLSSCECRGERERTGKGQRYRFMREIVFVEIGQVDGVFFWCEATQICMAGKNTNSTNLGEERDFMKAAALCKWALEQFLSAVMFSKVAHKYTHEVK